MSWFSMEQDFSEDLEIPSDVFDTCGLIPICKFEDLVRIGHLTHIGEVVTSDLNSPRICQNHIIMNLVQTLDLEVVKDIFEESLEMVLDAWDFILDDLSLEVLDDLVQPDFTSSWSLDLGRRFIEPDEMLNLHDCVAVGLEVVQDSIFLVAGHHIIVVFKELRVADDAVKLALPMIFVEIFNLLIGREHNLCILGCWEMFPEETGKKDEAGVCCRTFVKTD